MRPCKLFRTTTIWTTLWRYSTKSEINCYCGDLRSCSSRVDLSCGVVAGGTQAWQKERVKERKKLENTPTAKYSLRTLIKSHCVGGCRPRQRHFDLAFLLLPFYKSSSISDPAQKSWHAVGLLAGSHTHTHHTIKTHTFCTAWIPLQQRRPRQQASKVSQRRSAVLSWRARRSVSIALMALSVRILSQVQSHWQLYVFPAGQMDHSGFNRRVCPVNSRCRPTDKDPLLVWNTTSYEENSM